MTDYFDKLSTKVKCASVLLACLDWACSAKWSVDMEEKIRKRLKAQHKFDAVRLRSCIDLIQDTESAILNYSEHGLQKYSSRCINNDFGEIYLRLYGVLNSIYLQISTIIELFEVCRVPDKKKNAELLKSHPIFEIRNIIGAHTINFEDNSEYIPDNFNKNFFRVTQCMLNDKGDKMHAVGGFGGVKEFNLYELIMSYNVLSEKILYDMTIAYMDNIFASGLEPKSRILGHYKMENFKNFDYRALFKNDKLRKKQLDRFSKKIKDHFGNRWEEINKGEFSISDLEDMEQIYVPKLK